MLRAVWSTPTANCRPSRPRRRSRRRPRSPRRSWWPRARSRPSSRSRGAPAPGCGVGVARRAGRARRRRSRASGYRPSGPIRRGVSKRPFGCIVVAHTPLALRDVDRTQTTTRSPSGVAATRGCRQRRGGSLRIDPLRRPDGEPVDLPDRARRRVDDEELDHGPDVGAAGPHLAVDHERGPATGDREIVLEDGSAQRHRRAPAAGAIHDGEAVTEHSLAGLSDERPP